MRGRNRPYHLKYLWLVVVGAEGFEPPTLCSQSRCATRLRHAPPGCPPTKEADRHPIRFVLDCHVAQRGSNDYILLRKHVNFRKDCQMPHSPGAARSPAERPARAPLRVGIILAEHFTLSAFAVFIDHLRLAADEGDRSRPVNVNWSIMSSRRDSIPASCGVLMEPTSDLLAPELLDYVVVIGGILHAGPQIDDATLRYLRDVATTRVPLVGICTGSFILCRAGLMKGRRSCVS